MIIPDNVTVYMNGRAYYAHVCGFYWEGKRLSLSIDTSCLKDNTAEVNRVEPLNPVRREISINAQINGKSVNITYDPHDPEAVKAADVWRKALFADGTRYEYNEPVAVRPGDRVTFEEPRKETNGDKIRKADISVLSELLAAVKFGWWNNSYEIKSGAAVQHPEIFNKLNAYAGRMASGDITCLDLIRAMTDNDLSEWICLFQTREAEAWKRLLGASPDYSKPLIPESEREKFFFWLKKRPGDDCATEPTPRKRVTFDGEKAAETVKSGHWEKSDIPCEKYVCSECGGACWYYGYNGKLGKSRYCLIAGRVWRT